MSLSWSDVGRVAASVAPVLGTVLGGPAGGAVGALVASALGVESTPEAVSAAVSADPLAYAKLREIESAEKLRVLEMDHAARQAELADVANARAAQVATVQAGHGSAWIMPVLALLIVVAFISIAVAVIFFAPQGLGEVGALLVGGLVSAVTSVLGYYFGSSLGSARKTDAMLGGR